MLLYRLIFLPALLLGLPYYALRMWRRGGYRVGFGNRFGVMRNVPPKRKNVKRIWIQAVSVGELMAIGPLLKKLSADPAVEIILTTTTSTGLRVLKDKYAGLTAWHGMFPLDFWPCSARAWRILEPDLAVLMEGELWPEHIYQAHRLKVPVILANARLSDRSYSRHLKARRLLRPYLSRLHSILAGSTSDQDRFRRLGWIPEEDIILTGNLKLDVEQEAPPSEGERSNLLAELGFTGNDILLLLGSSTWPGEESALIRAYLNLRESFPGLRLLIVPRHAERKKELQALVRDFPVRFHFRSDSRQADGETDLYIADTTGELRMLTRFSDLLFVGKSLPPNSGGQTPVEAAALGKPMIFGPDMSNFRDISRALLDNEAACRIDSGDALEPALRDLLEDPEARARMGRQAYKFIETSRGSTDRILKHLMEALNRPGQTRP